MIFLRHGEKKYKNGKGLIGDKQHDPPLSETGICAIKTTTKKLLATYGRPDIIITSPFQRNRQTTTVILETIENPDNIIIEIDPMCGEFLGFQKPRGKTGDVSGETLRYINPVLGIETVENLKKRAILFYDKLIKRNKKIWIVTHGIFISFLFENLINKKLKFKELEGFFVDKNIITRV